MCYGGSRVKTERQGSGRARLRGECGGNMSEGVSPSPKGTQPGFTFHTDNFLGGFIIAILALFFLGCTFLISSPTVPRVMSILVAVVGVVIAAGLLPVRNPR